MTCPATADDPMGNRFAASVARSMPCIVALALVAAIRPVAAADEEDFFETEVRPVLVENCVRCHGESKQSGGLRLDSRGGLLEGGEGGPVIVVGQPAPSRLIQAVRREGDLEMPPDETLTQPQIDALTRWIEQGAVWPEKDVLRAVRQENATEHWAFQPVRSPDVPSTPAAQNSRGADGWTANPIDAFVLARLDGAHLTPSPEADRRTLIRRVYYTLTGLPPSPDEVDRFVDDRDPLAYERLIDRLLDLPQYGEHWARHWLDVARYSDTKGYVYAREERFWLHAWAYRDWVVRALNDDLPYDRFLLLQLAADQVQDRQPGDLAAMGFLTLGRRFLGVERDVIDDRIDVVCRGTMGLTVGCARCHDHKYDPIPTADYYSLYGVFDSCREDVTRLPSTVATDEKFEAELQKRQEALDTELATARAEWSDRARSQVADYLMAQKELQKYPPKGFDQIFEKTDVIPGFVRRWEAYLREAERRTDPIFVPWHAYFRIPDESFSEQAATVTRQLQAESERIHPQVAAAFAAPPASFAEVIDRYAALFADIDARWKTAQAAAESANEDPPDGFDDPADEQLRQVLYGPQAPCEVPGESIVYAEDYFDTGSVEKLWKLQGEVDRWIIQSKVAVPYAVALIDRPTPSEPRIFERGNPVTKGDEVPRQFLSLLSGPDRTPFQTGSGRRELARAIIDPANPLTARVIVNRVWAQHFGAGLVTTPSDFGTRADPPSHPELLDWLTHRFIADGWSLKMLHRRILQSATFRQAAYGPTDPDVLARAQQIDPANRLLWRMSPRRLSFEEFRDSLLAVAGDLNLALGGKPADLFKAPFPSRRTLYGLVDRQFFPNTLRAFDFANPDLHIPERPETTVPQQALFVMNHPFVLERAQSLARTIAEETPVERQVVDLFRRVYQRTPTEEQLSAAVQFLTSADVGESITVSPTVADWQYAYGTYDEAAQRVTDMTPLPHFTGQAWQGGPEWPDPQLGWVQLTARGGHPGNDRAHAAVRRWTAPRKMTVEIRSTLIHDARPGDGIRAFVVHSQQGLIASTHAHQQTHELSIASIDVEPGETIDFVVDIGNVLNNDQYLWRATISKASASEANLAWDSEADFTPTETFQLSPLEQLAHVLLCSNEFLFVD